MAGNICLRKAKPFPVFDVRNQFYPHSNLNDNPLWVSAAEPRWHCSLRWSPWAGFIPHSVLYVSTVLGCVRGKRQSRPRTRKKAVLQEGWPNGTEDALGADTTMSDAQRKDGTPDELWARFLWSETKPDLGPRQASW